MGADTGVGSKWAIGLLVYFIVYFIVVYCVANAQYQTTLTIPTSPFNTPENAYCDIPRCEPGSTCEPYDWSADRYRGSMNCELVSSLDVCSQIQGCSWINKTNSSFVNIITFGIFGTSNTYMGCDGQINITALYTGIVNPRQYVYISPLNQLTNSSSLDVIPLSETPLLHNSEQYCRGLYFTWYTLDMQAENLKSATPDTGEILKIMFGFSADLGFPADQPAYQIIFAIIFTYIPIVIGIFIIRMMLPV